MDEKKRILKVLERVETELESEFKPKVSHPNQTNPMNQSSPIYKNLAKFNNTKIGDKLTIKDLLR